MEQELNVKILRESLQLTQAQLAAAVGVDQSTISNWENGKKPRGPAKRILALLEKRGPKAVGLGAP